MLMKALDQMGKLDDPFFGNIPPDETVKLVFNLSQGEDERGPWNETRFIHLSAPLEREMIRERTIAGQERARSSGVRFGRPTIPSDKAEAIVADLKAGVGVVKLALRHGVGVSVVQRLKRLQAA
jgi:hypothetical protein